MIFLELESELEGLRASRPVLVLQFGASSCGPCAAIARKLERWSAGNSQTAAVYADVEKFPALAAEYGVFSVPTVLLFVKNRLFLRESGYFSVEELLARAERYLGMLEE